VKSEQRVENAVISYKNVIIYLFREQLIEADYFDYADFSRNKRYENLKTF